MAHQYHTLSTTIQAITDTLHGSYNPSELENMQPNVVILYFHSSIDNSVQDCVLLISAYILELKSISAI